MYNVQCVRLNFVPQFFVNCADEVLVDVADVESSILFETIVPVLMYAGHVCQDYHVPNVAVVLY